MITIMSCGEAFSSCNKGEKVPAKPRVRIPSSNLIYDETIDIVKSNNLNTVCQEAACPNIRECWNKRHASFMILGAVCTRKCTFCNIASGVPEEVNAKEPMSVALAVSAMNLKHVVITSVDRDDLIDGGAEHFAKTIEAIRAFCPETTIEILTPDFLGKEGALEIVMKACPDVYNHNIETVPSLYRSVRPKAIYMNSLNLLMRVKKIDESVFTKSGFMLGLGETTDELLQLMDDLRFAGVDFLTIGQYLQPTPKHAKVVRYATEEDFDFLKKQAYRKGFTMVSASALTRSSYHADEDFENLKKNYLMKKQGQKVSS